MPGLRSFARSCIGLSATLTTVTLAAGTALAELPQAIPQFASANFGWQSNLEDREDPPPGAAMVLSRMTRQTLS